MGYDKPTNRNRTVSLEVLDWTPEQMRFESRTKVHANIQEVNSIFPVYHNIIVPDRLMCPITMW